MWQVQRRALLKLWSPSSFSCCLVVDLPHYWRWVQKRRYFATDEHEIGTVTPFTEIILFLCLNSTLSHLTQRLGQLQLITILEILTRLPPKTKQVFQRDKIERPSPSKTDSYVTLVKIRRRKMLKSPWGSQSWGLNLLFMWGKADIRASYWTQQCCIWGSLRGKWARHEVQSCGPNFLLT